MSRPFVNRNALTSGPGVRLRSIGDADAPGPRLSEQACPDYGQGGEDPGSSGPTVTPPEPAFSVSRTAGPAPLRVEFTDETREEPEAWAWDFENDGVVNSREQSPVHVFEVPGVYTVRMAATNAGGTGYITYENLIEVQEPTGKYRIPITIPGSALSAFGELANFKLFVDLATLPSTFWAHLKYQDGRDIRVLAADGSTLLPFDLINVQPEKRTGALFVKVSLYTWEDNRIYLFYGKTGNEDFVPLTDPKGRYAVWSGYARVMFGGIELACHASGSIPTQIGTGFGLVEAATSPNLGVHQGVAWDGEHYYVTSTNLIKKFSPSWELLATNADPCGQCGNGVDHLGDPEVVGDTLYVPIEHYTSPSDWSGPRIARFRKSDLSFIDSVSVAAQGHEAATIAYCPRDGYLYLGSFVNGAALRRYDLQTLAYVDAITLSPSVSGIQGLTYWNDAWWISSDTDDAVYRAERSGAVRTSVWGLGGGASGAWEGLASSPDALLALHDTDGNSNGVVRRLEWRDVEARAGSRVFQSGSQQHTLGRFTTWTLAVTAIVDDKTANRAIASYGQSGSSDSTKRCTLAYQQSSDRIGVWCSTDGWLYDPIAPAAGEKRRYHVVQSGTTKRTLYSEGVAVASKTSPSQQPATGANALFIGRADATTAEVFDGKWGFAYLIGSAVPAATIAAEVANLRSPATFYVVGDEEPVE